MSGMSTAGKVRMNEGNALKMKTPKEEKTSALKLVLKNEKDYLEHPGFFVHR